jgi:4-hydroxy-tetrahydrodipicolinate synthase
MTSYAHGEERDWAREHFRGVFNVIIPSFSNDLHSVNEAAIRHDVRRDIELGFAGALMVSETATTMSEYEQCLGWAVDEARGNLKLLHHASFDTLEDNKVAARQAETAGAELMLLSYPPSFYPADENAIYEYTRALCDSTNLAVMIFAVPLWGFERVHPACLSVGLIERLITDCPNVVAVKSEGGYPSLGGFAQVWERFHDRVVVTHPIVQHAIPLATLLPLQAIATSNTEYYGDAVPQMLRLAQSGENDKAMEIFWRITPAWRANESIAAIPGANIVNRMAWKYQAWLNGFNGGPVRMPTTRIVWTQMQAFRRALEASGVDVTSDPDEAFFVGRNPI